LWRATHPIMTYKWAELMAMADERVIALHDAQAVATGTGTGLLRDELLRRELRKSARAANRMALANTLLAGVGVVIAVLAIALR
jgi:hypothetical protein